jgi:dTDP-4-dehydrorhamnose 3,5-epimerase
MPFTFKQLSIPEVILVEPKSFSDERGFFLESFKESIFSDNGINKKFLQDNYSHSVKGVLRGLHYQKNPNAQAKLVTALRGKIFDVAVDIRQNSPTFGKWVSEILSEENHNLLFIPEGFAHGFFVLSDKADVFYKASKEYSSKDDRGIMWNDPKIGIKWPTENPIMSKKDLELPSLNNADNNFVY